MRATRKTRVPVSEILECLAISSVCDKGNVNTATNYFRYNVIPCLNILADDTQADIWRESLMTMSDEIKSCYHTVCRMSCSFL